MFYDLFVFLKEFGFSVLLTRGLFVEKIIYYGFTHCIGRVGCETSNES